MKGNSFVLTVSQCKRLIAKGVAQLEVVKRAMRDGIVIVPRGSTNSYVLEELLGQMIEKERYVSGFTVPAGSGVSFPERLPEVTFEKGKPLEGVTVGDAIQRLGAGDVFIKGANALNYRAGIAAVLTRSRDGGTAGRALGPVIGRKAHWIIPVGLEKEVPFDVLETSRILASTNSDESTPALFPIPGEIFTEIEAVRVLFGLEAVPIGAGGIVGAEGSLRLYVYGEDSIVDRAAAFLASLQQEPAYGEGLSAGN